MRWTWIVAVILAMAVVAPLVSSAQEMGAKYTLSFTKDYTPSPWTGIQDYPKQVGHKAVFGGTNALFGWLELYNEPRDTMQAEKRMAPGLARGLANMVGDTIGGVAQIATCPVTIFDVALPEGGTDLL